MAFLSRAAGLPEPAAEENPRYGNGIREFKPKEIGGAVETGRVMP